MALEFEQGGGARRRRSPQRALPPQNGYRKNAIHRDGVFVFLGHVRRQVAAVDPRAR